MEEVGLHVRALQLSDIADIYSAFADSGWSRPDHLIERYDNEQRSGNRTTLVARVNRALAGYTTVRWHSDYLPFAATNVPEIQDLNVLPPFQRRGVGTRLMDEAEKLIFAEHPIAGIGVGLYSAYGAAQRLYVRRGYVPDGLGIAYQGNSVRPNREVIVDDDLVLYFLKERTDQQPSSARPGNAFAQWFDALKSTLESAYLRESAPWRQSGLMISDQKAWTACRKPIADCLDRSGTFLDIGCANGYLLETLVAWVRERGIEITPYGLDLSEKLIGLAKERLPEYKDNLYVGNGLDWMAPAPPRFDYVHSELFYVPEILQRRYVEWIIDCYLKADGRFLLTEYRSRRDAVDKPWLDVALASWGIPVLSHKSGFYDGKEVTRVFVIGPSSIP
jgi:GNAT superfamily N-acetyltransferase